jgi:hypothetical protein
MEGQALYPLLAIPYSKACLVQTDRHASCIAITIVQCSYKLLPTLAVLFRNKQGPRSKQPSKITQQKGAETIGPMISIQIVSISIYATRKQRGTTWK